MTYREQAFALMRGCLSHNCKIKLPKGMGNNGSCRCFERLSDIQANQIIRTLAQADEDVKALRDAIEGLLNALPSATTHPAIIAARAALNKTDSEIQK